MADKTPQIEPTLSSSGSFAPAYFDRLYAADSDPWDFASSTYEAEKYAATLAALPRPRYSRALELGCSIGVLTSQLALRCESVLAVDVSSAALAEARRRNRPWPGVSFEQADLSQRVPEGSFDLILVSEIGYYFALGDLEKLCENIAAHLAPRGHLLLVHYTGATNYPLTADEVHAAFLRWSGSRWRSLAAHRTRDYRLDLFEGQSNPREPK